MTHVVYVCVKQLYTNTVHPVKHIPRVPEEFVTFRVGRNQGTLAHSMPRDRFYSVEKGSCGIAMEVAKADSKTNWEELMAKINESIR